jgi:hypothetical protein
MAHFPVVGKSRSFIVCFPALDPQIPSSFDNLKWKEQSFPDDTFHWGNVTAFSLKIKSLFIPNS